MRRRSLFRSACIGSRLQRKFRRRYRYQDPNHAAFGLGIGYGFAFHLDKARRWSMEAQIGAGYLSYKWIKYHNTGLNGAEVSRGGGTYWGLTRAGIAISL